MSADNWDACPYCAKRRAAEIERREQEIKKAYGQVRVDLFDAMRSDLAGLVAAPIERTLREDYEVGLLEPESGQAQFFVRYKARCTECNWSHEFRHDDDVPVADVTVVEAPAEVAS